MKSPINYISIAREMKAFPSGIKCRTTIYFSRANDQFSLHFTIPHQGKHPISSFSVIRAKRAQLWLIERGEHHDQVA